MGWLPLVVGLLGLPIGSALTILYIRKTPLVPSGTEVKFTMDDDDEELNTGIYVRRASVSHDRVVPTSPLWWSAAREGREVVVRRRNILTPS